MAKPVELREAVPEEGVAPPAPVAAPRKYVRAVPGERWIARVLRGGALFSGGLFLASLGVELLPQSESQSVAVDALRKGAASLLLVTPIVRLAVAGTVLGLRGEWRYTFYAGCVLVLLSLAVGVGFAA